MFRFISSGPERSDCTAPYNILLDKEYTIREFIDTVLLQNEWGYIGIDTKRDIFGNPNCRYRGDKLLSTLPDEWLDKTIKSVRADGGWSRMDYYITV